MKDTMKEMIDAVKRHALDHYEESGWDYVVECYDDVDIQEVIEHAGAQSIPEAIDVVGCEVAIRDDYRKDIQGYAF